MRAGYIQDLGCVGGRSRLRLIKINSRSFLAGKRRNRFDPRQTVWVVSGNAVRGHLPKQLSQAHDKFSHTVRLSHKNIQIAEITAWKRFMSIKANVKKLETGSLIGVVWHFGPIPTLPIGKIEGCKVCITPYRVRFDG